jgi:hypothetical protein
MTRNQAVRIRAHKDNLDRYCRMLTTQLSELERQFLHRRIAEERLELDRLRAEADPQTSYAFVASQLRRVAT